MVPDLHVLVQLATTCWAICLGTDLEEEAFIITSHTFTVQWNTFSLHVLAY